MTHAHTLQMAIAMTAGPAPSSHPVRTVTIAPIAVHALSRCRHPRPHHLLRMAVHRWSTATHCVSTSRTHAPTWQMAIAMTVGLAPSSHPVRTVSIAPTAALALCSRRHHRRRRRPPRLAAPLRLATAGMTALSVCSSRMATVTTVVRALSGVPASLAPTAPTAAVVRSSLPVTTRTRTFQGRPHPVPGRFTRSRHRPNPFSRPNPFFQCPHPCSTRRPRHLPQCLHPRRTRPLHLAPHAASSTKSPRSHHEVSTRSPLMPPSMMTSHISPNQSGHTACWQHASPSPPRRPTPRRRHHRRCQPCHRCHHSRR